MGIVHPGRQCHRQVTPEQIKKAMESQMAEDDQKIYEAMRRLGGVSKENTIRELLVSGGVVGGAIGATGMNQIN